MNLKPLFVFLCLLFFLCSRAQQSGQDQDVKFPESGTYAKSKLSYKLISSPNSTYGYDIYSDSRLIIHQPSIPGVAGADGFKTKSDAGNVADLVIKKIRAGQMPPTVSIDEMQKLKALP